MTLAFLREWTEAGAGAVHRRILLRRWLSGRAVSEGATRASEQFPAAVIAKLPALATELDKIACIVSRHPSSDGSTRLLIRLADGRTVESVLLGRGGFCISTQIGCAVGCRFCKTGEGGLVRQLRAEELLAQVHLGQRERRARGETPLRRVVLMGMGEPAHNLAAVLRALSHLGNEGAFGHKQLVFSTVGDPRAIEALAVHDVKPALALSLHTLDDALREKLLPRAPRIPARELLALSVAYARATGYPLLVQWTLLAGVNDADADVDALAQALDGARAIVNVIPWNHVDGMEFERPESLRSVEFVRALKRRGVFATIRRSAGQDVDGACGQLRARDLAAAGQTGEG
ncbi:MAG TPA: RNA methyltransferase [Planctomycetota bacterium]|nr:RNA methyltransferase [Planctomycetota bacterium]